MVGILEFEKENTMKTVGLYGEIQTSGRFGFKKLETFNVALW